MHLPEALCPLLYSAHDAGIAQLVEHNLAKVGVAGSSPVSRSRNGTRERRPPLPLVFVNGRHGRGGEIGRREGLKIPWEQSLTGSSPVPGTHCGITSYTLNARVNR